jgi:thiaminase
MPGARSLMQEIGRDLESIEREIRHHPYLTELEKGRIGREDLKRFAGEQYHIIRSDLRSVALLVNRFGVSASGPFFQGVLGGEAAALDALRAFARALGMSEAMLERYEPAPGALAYSAFMAWLALYGEDAEVSAGLLVNFAAWGANCGRMSRALRSQYGLGETDTAFFDLFAAPPEDFATGALAVIDAGLARGADPRLIKRSARLLQGYEALFWDTIYALSRR